MEFKIKTIIVVLPMRDCGGWLKRRSALRPGGRGTVDVTVQEIDLRIPGDYVMYSDIDMKTEPGSGYVHKGGHAVSQGRCHANRIWPNEDWKARFGLRPQWRLARCGKLLFGGSGACGGM